MRYRRVVFVFAAASCLATVMGETQGPNNKEMRTYIDLMRKDVLKEKLAVVDRAMGLEAAKKSEFWAIYANYQAELDAIWDQRIANIKKYADNYNEMTDEVADQLAVKMMDLEGQRAALRSKYYNLLKEQMGSRTAARFLQVEVSLASLIDLQLASEIPILQ